MSAARETAAAVASDHCEWFVDEAVSAATKRKRGLDMGQSRKLESV